MKTIDKYLKEGVAEYEDDPAEEIIEFVEDKMALFEMAGRYGSTGR